MACDRYTLSTPRTPGKAARAPQHRHPIVELRSVRIHARGADLSDIKLAAAEARIAALESALQEAKKAASHDILTGVLNRRGLVEAFARESARAQRSGNALTLVLIDLDDFKAINDTHGHAAGDQALQHLTRLIGSTLRPTDCCARLGGDEFVLLLANSTLPAAQIALERLHSATEASPLIATQSCLRFSTGMACAKPGESLESLLERADQGVYRAKARRRHA